MFLLYYVWGFFFYIVSLTHSFIERNFLLQNNPFLIRKRTFKYISYFEKLFLVLFYRSGWFDRTIANLFRRKDIVEYRRHYYPLINSFHLYYDKVDYELSDLKLLCKQYDHYLNYSLIGRKFNKILVFCFKKSNKLFLNFLSVYYLFYKNYYNYHSSVFFHDCNNLNTVKLNWIFGLFLVNSKHKLVFFDLDIWSDWYEYIFSDTIIERLPIKIYISKKEKDKMKEFKKIKLEKWIKVVFKYKLRYQKVYKFFNKEFPPLLFFNLNYFHFFKLKINKDFLKLMKNYYMIKFSESSISKFINPFSLKNYSISYLRKNRIFNKGRYSRNRQLYRTGVYWCLWLNIIMVYGLYFIFYRFSFNFGYVWWGILILAYSTIFSRIVKYNFYNLFYLYRELIGLIKWYGFIFTNSISLIEDLGKTYLLKISIYNYTMLYKNNNLGFYFNSYYPYFTKLFKIWVKKRQRIKMVFIWQGMKFKDTSFLRYKTILHFIKETYRLFTTW